MWAWQGSCGSRWWRLTTIRLYPSVPLVLKGCPQSRGCPVLSSHASGVQPNGVVSDSLGSACGQNGPSLFKPTRPPSEAWRLYSESDAHLSFDEIRRASIGISAVELVPQHVVELTEAVASDRSSLAISDLFLAWRFWQGERLTWREPSVVSLPPRSWARSPGAWAGRALWGWLGGWSAGIYPRPACTICATQYWDTLFVRELPICDECRIDGYDSDCSPSDSGSSS